MSHREMDINGVRYHIEVDGSGAPLALLHGFTGSSENWQPIRPALTDYFAVVTVDLLGHGRTDAPDDPRRYAIEAAADDLAAIFYRLGLPRVHLLGYSMGGRLALYFALHYPALLHTLVLESASPGLRTDAERFARAQSDEQLARMIESEGLEAFVDYWTSLPLFAAQSADLRQRLRAQRLKNNPRGLANSLRGMGTGSQPSLWVELAQLSCPTLLIAGEKDAKFAHIAREMQALIKSVQCSIIPHAGHTVHAEQPEQYAQTVLQFLSSYN